MNLFEESKMPLIRDLVKLINEHGLDQYGKVFLYGDNFYRGITPQGANNIISAFNTGAIDELQAKNLIPKTQIVPYELPEYVFILQHEKIKNVTYAYEWSFSMLQDAALMCLDVFEVLVKHGFGTQDIHTSNILFKNNHPVWVDITSFIPSDTLNQFIILNFFINIYQPLEIMSINPILARERLKNHYGSFETEFYLNLTTKFGLTRQKYFNALLRRYAKLFARQSAETDKKKIFHGIEKFRQKIKKLKMNYPSQWSTYQNNWINSKKEIILKGGGR